MQTLQREANKATGHFRDVKIPQVTTYVDQLKRLETRYVRRIGAIWPVSANIDADLSISGAGWCKLRPRCLSSEATERSLSDVCAAMSASYANRVCSCRKELDSDQQGELGAKLARGYLENCREQVTRYIQCVYLFSEIFKLRWGFGASELKTLYHLAVVGLLENAVKYFTSRVSYMLQPGDHDMVPEKLPYWETSQWYVPGFKKYLRTLKPGFESLNVAWSLVQLKRGMLPMHEYVADSSDKDFMERLGTVPVEPNGDDYKLFCLAAQRLVNELPNVDLRETEHCPSSGACVNPTNGLTGTRAQGGTLCALNVFANEDLKVEKVAVAIHPEVFAHKMREPLSVDMTLWLPDPRYELSDWESVYDMILTSGESEYEWVWVSISDRTIAPEYLLCDPDTMVSYDWQLVEWGYHIADEVDVDVLGTSCDDREGLAEILGQSHPLCYRSEPIKSDSVLLWEKRWREWKQNEVALGAFRAKQDFYCRTSNEEIYSHPRLGTDGFLEADEPSHVDAESHKVLEACKVRMITKSDGALSNMLRVQQQVMQKAVAGTNWGQFTGHPVRDGELPGLCENDLEEISDEPGHYRLADGRLAVSIDYKAATDYINMYVTLYVWALVCQRYGWGPSIYKAGRLALCENRIKTPHGTFIQRNGQLMGCIISFPLLCIINAATMVAAGVTTSRMRVNGDDGAALVSRLEYGIWQKFAKLVGFKFSLGKNYCSSRFLTINSQLYVPIPRANGVVHWRYVPYVNLGLMHGQKRVLGDDNTTPYAESSQDWGAIAHSLVAGFDAVRSNELMAWFTAINHEKFPARPWHLPRHYGGLGLPGDVRSCDPRHAAVVHYWNSLNDTKKFQWSSRFWQIEKERSPAHERALSMTLTLPKCYEESDNAAKIDTTHTWLDPRLPEWVEKQAALQKARQRAFRLAKPGFRLPKDHGQVAFELFVRKANLSFKGRHIQRDFEILPAVSVQRSAWSELRIVDCTWGIPLVEHIEPMHCEMVQPCALGLPGELVLDYD